MTGEIYKGVYEKMEREGKFPKVDYREYPKVISLKNGSRVVVANQAEELRMIDEVVPIKDVAKLEADKGNLEKLLAESQARLEELKTELAAGKHTPEALEKPVMPAPLAKPIPPTKPSAPDVKAS